MVPVSILKALVFIKNYWYLPVFVIVSLLLYFIFRYNGDIFFKILDKSEIRHKKEMESIKKIEEERNLKLEETKRKHEQTLAYIETQFLKERKILEENQQEELRKLIKTYENKPDKLVAKIAQKYGLTIETPHS